MKKHTDKTGKKLRDDALDLAESLHQVGAMDITTLRDFKAWAIAPVEDLPPTKIKAIRLKEKVSQAVFAKLLNTTLSTVRHWEQGIRHPRGTSLKLLHLVARNGINILHDTP
ncbi:MAG: helix-turn-helix domain-containing protein [Coxiellaceae bacterium]|nr:helix-turn-helix domain-containing protein [Coxiellaceae bacterium]